MKILRILQIVALVIAAVALTYVYFVFRDHFYWLVAGLLIGLALGIGLTMFIIRWMRGGKGGGAPVGPS